jgi:2-polyprenyl-3-methyl-5-hydroxy-6-metoxy-1,4-benzoquinol methylase
MPVEADLPKLYEGYYTHRFSAVPEAGNTLRERVRAAYLHARYGYAHPSHTWMDTLFGMAPYVHPAWKDSLDASVFLLHARPGGRLLEVGCGSGATLQRMERMGWGVTGLDFDGGAVANARSRGLDVRHGQLSAQNFPDGCFDAVVMSHVIEHVPAPVELLAECRRILKQGGMLVVQTPNADSRGHRHYGRSWRGLEPPRHLQVLTPGALLNVASRIGFTSIEAFASMNGFVYQDLASKELAVRGKHSMGSPVPFFERVLSHIKAFGLGWWNVLSSGREGGEAVLVCRK